MLALAFAGAVVGVLLPYIFAGVGIWVLLLVAVLVREGNRPKTKSTGDEPMRLFGGVLIVLGVVVLFFSLLAGAFMVGLGVIVVAIRRPASKGKPCPFCAEIIRPEASVCRYCGRQVAPDAEFVRVP